MKTQKLSIRSLQFVLAITLLTSCGNNQKKAPSNLKEDDSKKQEVLKDNNHNHSAHNFSDKHSVEQLSKRFESPERDDIEKPQHLLKIMGNIEGKTIMDIGAGTGYYSVKFAEKGAKVIAADVSDQFQSYLENRIKEKSISNIVLRKVHYDNPMLNDSEVDIVFIANTYHHIANRIAYLEKVKKGLKNNGEIVILDYLDIDFPSEVTAPPKKMRVSIDKVINELKQAGFAFFQIEAGNLPYHYVIKAKL